jgi:hypothetical protein
MFTYTHLIQMSSPRGAVSASASETDESSLEMDVSIPIGTNTPVFASFPVPGLLLAYVFLANVAMTIKVNSISSPSATITLAANVGQFWTTISPLDHIVGDSDITNIYVTAAAVGTLKIRVLYNPTGF